MAPSYEKIVGSNIFKFVIGPDKKEYNIHAAAISSLSKPLDVLLNGDMREAKEGRVEWPDVDEKTFLRFTQWAYTEDYVTEEPDIVLDHSSVDTSSFDCKAVPIHSSKDPEKPLYSLDSCGPSGDSEDDCRDRYCSQSVIDPFNAYPRRGKCNRCRRAYNIEASCSSCVAYTPTSNKRADLIGKFLDKSGINYLASTSAFRPRKNAKGCEDYTGVFLCHARLYILGDKYDIPPLKELTLHRLHATLKEFTLYPSRMNDIATLAQYIFENTVKEDKIRDMITLYYACIVEDALKYDGLKSVVDDIPDFAFGLISMMKERLA